MQRLPLLLTLTWFLASCVSWSGWSGTQETHGTSIKWYTGDVEAALEIAKSRQQLTLLYWGAVWCPPCNDLKQNVFSDNRFPEVVQNMIPVYLDGDQELAQVWADKLAVTGYPTVLILDPDGKELTRISETLTFDEFALAVSAVREQRSQTFEDVFSLAGKGKASTTQWVMIAYHNWFDGSFLKDRSDPLISERIKLVDLFPDQLVTAKANFVAKLVTDLADDYDKHGSRSKFSSSISGDDRWRYLDFLLASDEKIFAARQLFIYETGNVLAWLAQTQPQNVSKIEDRWMKAVELIRKNPTVGLDLWVWTHYPEVEFHGYRHPKAGVAPAKLRKKIVEAVSSAANKSETEFQRAAVIPGAAYLLSEVGEGNLARKLLSRELRISKSPWYIYASLASLEERLGNDLAALKYVGKAQESARGRATKLQWKANQLLMTIRLRPSYKEGNLDSLIRDFFEYAYSLNDGFSGRNLTRLESVRKALMPIKDEKLNRDIIEDLTGRCSKLTMDQQPKCQSFWALLQ